MSLTIAAMIFLSGRATAQQFTVGIPEVVKETRIDRTIFEYTMRAKVTNTGAAAAGLAATLTINASSTVVIEDTLEFGNVGPLTTADSVDTFVIAHDRTEPFDPIVLKWTFKQPFIVSNFTPQTGATEVGVTVRPQVFFSKPVDATTLNSSNFYASFGGQKLPATILPSNDCTFAWLFLTNPMPGASQLTITVDGSTIRLKTGTPADLLDGANSGTSGSKLVYHFSTVSVAPVPGTTLRGIIADPGPDMIPRTPDDVRMGPNGFEYRLPIAGVKIYLLGLESKAAFTDAAGSFTLENMPVGNVKIVMDGRTATNLPAGCYFPEMVMDTTFTPGIANGIMTIRNANGEEVYCGGGFECDHDGDGITARLHVNLRGPYVPVGTPLTQ